MKRRIKLGRKVELTGPDQYCVFYDAKTLAEIYCFLFQDGKFKLETEWGESVSGTYSPRESFPDVLAKNDFVLV